MIRYIHPSGVSVIRQPRPLLSTTQGGAVAVDAVMLALWQQAHGRELDELVSGFKATGTTPDLTRAALVCLSEAGLLAREGEVHNAIIPQPTTGPLVSAIIVGYNGRRWLEECLPSLFAQTHSPLEIIVVDNDSRDDSVAWVQTHYPQVKLLCLSPTRSFAYALNAGVMAAQGDYMLFLNQDLHLKRDAVAELVTVAQHDATCAAVAAKLKFWWAPAFLNGLGNRVGAFSWGTDNAIGHLDLGQFDDWRDVPSACFAVALIRRSAWETIGPVDEGFSMYYEDAEWCYRARLLGYNIAVASKAVAYHAFGGWMPTGTENELAPRKLQNAVQGRLRFAVKLLSASYLRRFLRNYVLEDAANFMRLLGALNFAQAQAYPSAWRELVRGWPSLQAARRTLQAQRVRQDGDLFALQKTLPDPLTWHNLPQLSWDLVQHIYWPLIKSGQVRSMPEFSNENPRPHVLIVSQDIIAEKMAGPGVRYLEMARALSSQLEVTLAVPTASTLTVDPVHLVHYDEKEPSTLQVLVENSDIALVSGYMVDKFHFLHGTRTRLIVDLYDPFVLENLHYYLHEPLEVQNGLNQKAVEVTNELARLGDYFICGNERQRDFWMGVLTANQRINPQTFQSDNDLRSMLDVVGVGIPDREPNQQPLLRNVHPGFIGDVRIVLWGGGIWNWLDSLTLVRAWPQVIQQHPEARLVFLGTRHPNPHVPSHALAAQTEELAAELGEKNRTIFFFEWLSYTDREALLCEADIGVTLHPLHIETRYSIRTRVLDYIWARLPILVSDGDVTSEWVRQHNIGCVTPPHDVDAVASALCQMLVKPRTAWAPNFSALRQQLRWSQVAQPLARYCLTGSYAPDRLRREFTPVRTVPKSNWRVRLIRGVQILRTAGPRVLLHHVGQYIQWRLARV